MYNDFALCNWSTAQPSKKKDRVNNLSFLKVVVLFFSLLFVRGNYTMQIYTIYLRCFFECSLMSNKTVEFWWRV